MSRQSDLRLAATGRLEPALTRACAPHAGAPWPGCAEEEADGHARHLLVADLDGRPLAVLAVVKVGIAMIGAILLHSFLIFDAFVL
jgi:hypothetical protein